MQKNQKNSKKLIWGPFQVPFGPKTQKSFRSIVSLYAQKNQKRSRSQFFKTLEKTYFGSILVPFRPTTSK